jgi:ABC-type multidrug transport system ATPase subunit
MMIHIENITVHRKGKLLFDNIDITLKEKTAIVGQNGSGKTTLLKALCGKEKIADGQITLNESFIIKNQISKKNNIFMYIPKDYSNFFRDLKIKHILTFFARNTEHSYLLKERKIDLNSRFKDLNNIQKMALFIDVGKKNDKKIFLLDEPFLKLDMVETEIFKKVLKEHLGDLAIILTSNTVLPSHLDFNQELFIHHEKLVEEDPFKVNLSS